MGITYDREQTTKAKAEKLHLVTLDITGKHAKKGGASYQGYLLTDEEVKRAWEFFMWLASERHKSKPTEG